jgi:hypothetical protein
MNKSKSIEASLHKLAASFARSTSNLGLAPISLERRRELTARIKAKPEVIRSTLAAANAHPGLLGDNLDPKAIAIRRTLEAATHTEGGAGLVHTLSTMKQKRRRSPAGPRLVALEPWSAGVPPATGDDAGEPAGRRRTAG